MLRKYLHEIYEHMQAHSRMIGLLTAVMLTLLTFAFNLAGGPLYNLNDIHNWSNRLMFTGFSAVMHLSLLLFLVMESHRDIGHLLVRQILITVSLIIMFFAMNQKTFAYNTQIQPIVRAMDTEALNAISRFESGYSVPALTLYYILTRGPIYDMYLAKLFCIGCYELLCISFMHIARIKLNRTSWRPECALALAVILPQGFLSSACAAQIEVAGVLLVVLAYILLDRGNMAGYVLFGMGAAICTSCWLLIPILILRKEHLRLGIHEAALMVLSAMLCCVPGAIFGSGAKAFFSLFSCMTSLPVAGSGVPGLVSFFPRAVMEEIPEYAYLRAVPALDMVSLSADNYKEIHYAILMHGISFANLAIYIGLSAYELKQRGSMICKILTLLLIAFICASSVTMGAWQIVSVLCVFAMVFEPVLRIPCGIILFATAGGCAYPVAGEIMIKPVYICILCIIAIGMLMELWPGKGKQIKHES